MDMENANDQLIMFIHVVAASVLGGLVGLEREFAGKPAGLRTNMIIGGAAALLVSLGNVLTASYAGNPIAESLRVDPLRIVEAIIVGISFIGAGTILQMEKDSRVRYLTTAASFLFSAGIGISVALQQYFLSAGLTVFVIIVNYFVGFLGKRIGSRGE